MPDQQSSRILQYHLPDDPRYSIAYIDDNIERSKSKREQLEDNPDIDVVGGKVPVGDNEVYHIYTQNNPDRYIRRIDGDEGIEEWLESLSQDDAQFIRLTYDSFEGVLNTVDNNNISFDLYKRMQHRKIAEIPNKVQWRQSVAEVGGELLSRFILAHPMPNSNHRTALGILDRYLASYDPEFRMPDTGKDQSWYPWASDFIFDSKRILTLRRKLRLLQRARECGYDRVRRKDGAEIDLHEINFNRQNYTRHYRREHMNRSEEFVKLLLERTESEHLKETQDEGKGVFIDRLKASD